MRENVFYSAICLACMRRRESNKQYLRVYPKKKMSPYTLDSKCQFYLIFKNLRYRKMSYNFRLEQINSFLTIHILNLFCSQARTPDSFVSWKTALWQIPYWWSSIFFFFKKKCWFESFLFLENFSSRIILDSAYITCIGDFFFFFFTYLLRFQLLLHTLSPPPLELKLFHLLQWQSRV